MPGEPPLGPSRLLVICGSHSADRWALEEPLRESTCEWAHDLYDALARLASGPHPFDALVLAPECLSRAVVAAVPMVRKHLNIPVWILDKNTAPFRGHVEKALAYGAIRFPARTQTPPAVAAPEKAPEAHPPILPPKPLNGNGHAQPHPLTGKMPIRPEQESARLKKSVANEKPAGYDDSTQEPLLSDAELKALLGDEP